jgi:hypothetical protein
MVVLLLWVMGRKLIAPGLVVILQINYFSVFANKPKRQSPISVDGDGPVIGEFALQGM